MSELAVRRRQILYVALAVVAVIPAVALRLAAFHPPEGDPGMAVLAAAVFGLGIVGAAFMLSWAAEVVQLDIAAGLALALLALIAVLPEYAVDFVFTWKAGVEFVELGGEGPFRYAPLALANMTGGNQLLIGVGWPLVVLVGTYRIRKILGKEAVADVGSTAREVVLHKGQAMDMAYLTLASVYGLTLPLRSSLTMFDALVLVGIYAAYLIRLGRAPAEEPHLVGPAALVGALPRVRRRVVNLALFVVSAGTILAAAEPFADSLVGVGEEFGISEFLLVKWIAPLASESPELLVAALFAWRLAPSVGLGALVSSKVNQWTLLVGTLPLVFAISSASFHGLPLGIIQRDELLVTAAQSIFAVAVLTNLSMSRAEAWVLLVLFVGQLASSGVLPERYAAPGRIVVGAVFLAAAAWVLGRRGQLRQLARVVSDGLRKPYDELVAEPRE